MQARRLPMPPIGAKVGAWTEGSVSCRYTTLHRCKLKACTWRFAPKRPPDAAPPRMCRRPWGDIGGMHTHMHPLNAETAHVSRTLVVVALADNGLTSPSDRELLGLAPRLPVAYNAGPVSLQLLPRSSGSPPYRSVGSFRKPMPPECTHCREAAPVPLKPTCATPCPSQAVLASPNRSSPSSPDKHRL